MLKITSPIVAYSLLSAADEAKGFRRKLQEISSVVSMTINLAFVS